MDNRPRGREKNITGTAKDIYKRGQGLGTGPVGNAGGYQGGNAGGYQPAPSVAPQAPAIDTASSVYDEDIPF